jgi:hypothetical protein
MKKIVLLVLLMCFSMPILAEDDTPLTRTFDVSQYNPTEVDFVKAAIRGMQNKGWKIDAYEKGRIQGSLKRGQKVEILFDGMNVTIQELPGNGHFKESWIDSLEAWVNQGLTYEFYVRQAEQM